jgi:hypothetical protein
VLDRLGQHKHDIDNMDCNVARQASLPVLPPPVLHTGYWLHGTAAHA